MERELMIRSMEMCLVDGGYRVSAGSGCFDLLARKDTSIALKVLMNVDSFTHSEADDLKAISYFLDTFPFLVGERANRYSLEESVIYERFGIAAMSPQTFSMFVHGIMPSVKSRRGGYTVKANGRKLRSAMDRAGMSVGDLSSIAGLSQKTLYKCSKGGTIDVGTSGDIERAVGVPINSDFDVERVYDAVSREPRSSFKRALSGHLDRLGMVFSFLSRSPFNLVMKEDETLVSVASVNKKRLAAQAGVLEGLEREFDLSAVFITAHGKEKSMHGIPVVSLREVKGMESGKEFVENVAERR